MSLRDSDDDDTKPRKKAAPKAAPRRSVLKTAGLAAGGVLLAAAGGVGFRVNQTGAHKSFADGPGFEPWRAWDRQTAAALAPPPPSGETPTKTESGLAGRARGLIEAGILAASPHNSQPWRFVARDKTVDVIVDERRNLGPLDPIRRELNIAMGCCVENMVLGASAVGLQPLLNILPDGLLGPVVARLTLYTGVGSPTKEALALGKRHTDRGAYLRERALERKTLDTLGALVSSNLTRLIWLKADDTAGQRFAEGTLKATADFIADQELAKTSEAWFRFGPGDHRDGLTLPCVGLPPLKVRIAMMLPKGLQEDPHRAWLTMTRDIHLATAPMYGLIVVPALDNRAALIEAGRLWQRLHVHGTVMGLAMQPLNQLMEMADRDQALQRPSTAAKTIDGLATFGGDAVAFAFRLGYSRSFTWPSPRRPVEDVLTT